MYESAKTNSGFAALSQNFIKAKMQFGVVIGMLYS